MGISYRAVYGVGIINSDRNVTEEQKYAKYYQNKVFLLRLILGRK